MVLEMKQKLPLSIENSFLLVWFCDLCSGLPRIFLLMLKGFVSILLPLTLFRMMEYKVILSAE